MRKIKMMIGLIALVSITSCTMTKKRYSSGYHIEWKNNKTTAQNNILEQENSTKQKSIHHEQLNKVPPKNHEASINSKKLYIEKNLIIDKIKTQKIDDEPKNNKDSKLIREVTKVKKDGTIVTKKRYGPGKIFNKKETKSILTFLGSILVGALSYGSLLFGFLGLIYTIINLKNDNKKWVKKALWIIAFAIILKFLSILVGLWMWESVSPGLLSFKNFIIRVFKPFSYGYWYY